MFYYYKPVVEFVYIFYHKQNIFTLLKLAIYIILHLLKLNDGVFFFCFYLVGITHRFQTRVFILIKFSIVGNHYYMIILYYCAYYLLAAYYIVPTNVPNNENTVLTGFFFFIKNYNCF